jgi:V8-like Glu-specific endopeptidase
MAQSNLLQRTRLEITPLEDRLLCSAAHLVADSTATPFRAVAKVITWWDLNNNGIKDPGEVFGASATMIGPRTALTSGHVVFDSSLGGFATSVTILPGLNGGKPPLGSFNAQSWVIPTTYKRTEEASSDLAVLNFAQNIGKITGWFGVKAIPDNTLLHAQINNIGYPGDTHSGDQQFFSDGSLASLTPDEVLYPTTQLPVEHGSSGSPVYVNAPSGVHEIVGVHSRRIENGAIGISARITPAMVNFIARAETESGSGGFVASSRPVLPGQAHPVSHPVHADAWAAVHTELGTSEF